MPALVLIALAAVLFLKPWNHLSVAGPTLPTLSAVVTSGNRLATTPERPS